MKAQLTLEFIGANTWDHVRALARMAEAIGVNLGQSVMGEIDSGPSVVEVGKGSARKVFGDRDYSKANSKGSRGVMVRYILESDRLYFVRSPISWRNVDEYFCAVREDGTIYRLDSVEVAEWQSAL